MKIFSQSTACALIAVANAGARADVSTNANHHVYLRDTSLLGYFPDQATAQQPIAPFISTNGQLSCVGVPRRSRDKNIVHCTYELYGGWDLPVPPSTKSEFEYLTDGEPSCFMGHLPRRGEMGKMERIDCSSNEMTAFRLGDGPTGFTGFVSWVHTYTYQRDMIVRDQKCWLVANGKLTPILGECRHAVYKNEPDRHVVEETAYGRTEYYY